MISEAMNFILHFMKRI